MPVRRSSRTQVPDQQIELIGTGSVGLVWSGQHLEHNAQRQKPLRALLLHSAITIEGKKIHYGTFQYKKAEFANLMSGIELIGPEVDAEWKRLL